MEETSKKVIMSILSLTLLTGYIQSIDANNYSFAESKTEVKYVSRGLPRGVEGDCKTYMDYRSITDKSSKQYELQEKCETDKNGFRRYNEYYTVAMGTFYSEEVGKKFRITLKDGEDKKEILCIVGDIKQDIHTNKTNQYVPQNENIVEFIVNKYKLDSMCRKMGDVSYTEDGSLKGKIVKIEEIVED